jgi:hypothetical protein
MVEGEKLENGMGLQPEKVEPSRLSSVESEVGIEPTHD